MTAPFVLASSIWLLEGPVLNDLIAIVKERESAAQIAGSGQVLTAPSPSAAKLRAHPARLVVGKDPRRTTLRRDEYRAPRRILLRDLYPPRSSGEPLPDSDWEVVLYYKEVETRGWSSRSRPGRRRMMSSY